MRHDFGHGSITTCLALASILVSGGPALAAQRPVPVSPGAKDRSAAVEARCPTFLWAGAAGSRGYEVAVFRVSDDGAEPILVTRVSVPGDARGWTPSSSECLERGERYAWSVASAAGGRELEWSAPFLFAVDDAPSADEVAKAIATLQRHLDHAADASPPGAEPKPSGLAGLLPGPLTAPTTTIRVASAATTPVLGSASLSVDNQLHLKNASALFKADTIFLWDDTTGNTALGRSALANVTNSAVRNTAVGWQALQYSNDNTSGALGSNNMAIGYRALRANTGGFQNTAAGYQALRSNTTGVRNTALGSRALQYNTTGSRNTAIGVEAGESAVGSDNILIHSEGATESRVLRIGKNTLTGEDFSLDKAFIQGIRGVTPGAAGITVVIDANGQLGTVASSRRLKQDVQDLDPFADRLLELRPVAFRFRQHVETDPDTPPEFGLIAEEVAEVFPELVVFDQDGQPSSVKYHLLSALLLDEVQRLHARLEAIESQRSGSRPPEAAAPELAPER